MTAVNKKKFEVYKKGNRVQLVAAPSIKGTVKEIKQGGLYVHVKWDKFQHPTIIKLGSIWLVSSIEVAK